jgi:hypothetical protein
VNGADWLNYNKGITQRGGGGGSDAASTVRDCALCPIHFASFSFSVAQSMLCCGISQHVFSDSLGHVIYISAQSKVPSEHRCTNAYLNVGSAPSASFTVINCTDPVQPALDLRLSIFVLVFLEDGFRMDDTGQPTAG